MNNVSFQPCDTHEDADRREGRRTTPTSARGDRAKSAAAPSAAAQTRLVVRAQAATAATRLSSLDRLVSYTKCSIVPLSTFGVSLLVNRSFKLVLLSVTWW